MTERLRKILYGKNVTPRTADEAAIKYAVENGGGGGSGGGDSLVILHGAPVEGEDGSFTAPITGAALYEGMQSGKTYSVIFPYDDVDGSNIVAVPIVQCTVKSGVYAVVACFGAVNFTGVENDGVIKFTASEG